VRELKNKMRFVCRRYRFASSCRRFRQAVAAIRLEAATAAAEIERRRANWPGAH
jgi:hypothetical protein